MDSKKAMEGNLPKDIIYRKKVGFGAPIKDLLKNDLFDQNQVFQKEV